MFDNLAIERFLGFTIAMKYILLQPVTCCTVCLETLAHDKR